MTIKITTPNGGSDSLDFGCAQTAIVATVTGTEVSSGEGKLAFNTTTSGTSKERMRLLNNGTLEAQSPASATGIQAFKIDWKNENNAGIMASIGCDRTASSAAPADLVFSTSTSVDSGAISEKMRVTSAGLLKFNSGYGSAATAYGCRAWVNFNGTGTVAIRESGNVSSITDNSTGDYTVNFAVAMVDVNYSPLMTGDSSGSRENTWGRIGDRQAVPTAAALRVRFCDDQSSNIDTEYAQVAVFR
jgi:uncharacterized protein (DUF2147 family)